MGNLITHTTALATANLLTKLEVPSFTHFKDMKEDIIVKNSSFGVIYDAYATTTTAILQPLYRTN